MPGHSHRHDRSTVPPLSSEDLSILAETFRLLGDPTRLRILIACLSEPRAVGEIAESLEVSQTLVSHHLRLLRGARLVRRERASRQMFYEVADAHISDILINMLQHINEDTTSSED